MRADDFRVELSYEGLNNAVVGFFALFGEEIIETVEKIDEEIIGVVLLVPSKRSNEVADLSLEWPRCVGFLLFQEILYCLTKLPKHQTVVILDLFLVKVLEVLIGGEKLAEMLQTEKTLKHTVHVTGVTQVIQSCLWSVVCVFQLEFLIILTVKSMGTGFEVETLVFNAAAIVAIINLMADTADDQWFFLYTLLTITFQFSIAWLLFQGFSYFNDQGVSALEVLINI